MTTMTRLLATAGLMVAGGALLAFAQEPATSGAGAPDARIWQASAERGDDRGRRHGHGHRRAGERGAMLGAFGPAGGRALFATVDADGDGAITQTEIDAYLDAQVATADADGDGALALEEFAPVFYERLRPRMVDAFQRLDEDGSGAITAAEIDARFGAIVERMDRNGDDALSREDRRRGRDGERDRD